ncbi:hypothetical protein K432DRAFT_349927 [Lepidopterella palustris CBS 459.81]|uniref:Uncharacterized protein n=1 Tax=Lepidopterella palustris CBS 459.81 TaxID=1314670 RepID=A0A8E2EDY4_9PEZI|nr:hypothetical protein K432DRAFT_349927 [Lepidopterella palustris CBS 459.81]
MRNIYSGASETCLWLGDEVDDSDLAMNAAASLGGDDLESPKNNFNPEQLEAIAKLRERPRWCKDPSTTPLSHPNKPKRQANIQQPLDRLCINPNRWSPVWAAQAISSAICTPSS